MNDLINQVHNQDCLEILKQIPTESVDCVATDCPYHIIAGGVRTEYKNNECSGVLGKRDYSKTDPKGVLNRGKNIVSTSTLGAKWLKSDGSVPSAVKNGKMFEYNEIKFSEWLPEIFRVLKKGTHCYIMVDGANLYELQQEAYKVGFVYQNLLIWNKGNATPNKWYMKAVEFILMLSKRPARNINNMGSKTIINIPNIIGNKKHPTEKPVQLMEHLILNSTQENDIVLEPFAGAGSTLLAAQKLNRRFIGCEIDPLYHKICVDRLNGEYDKGSLI
jgi:site-specific DNA-methyltransferase (adenine-specific)